MFGETKQTNYYHEKLQQGLEFQDFVVDKLFSIGLSVISYSSKKYQNIVGETKNGIEIKFDNLYKKTGNLYFEIAEKSNSNNKNYINSGIYRNDNTWLYCIGDYEKLFIISKKHLIEIHRNNKVKEKITSTSKGFILDVKYVENKLSILTI